MAEMTVQEAKTLLTDWAEWLNDKHETWREVNLTDKEGEQIAALIEQQAQEIERLQIREHRMIEYMRDIKNFAFTINEVANNAIEEAEVQDNGKV